MTIKDKQDKSNHDERRARFIRVKRKKLNRAKEIIDSFNTLSVRSNYKYKEDELWDIIQALTWQVKELMLNFSKNSSIEKKIEQLVLLEVEQMRAIKVYDEELFSHITNKLPKGLLPAVENYIDRAAFESPMYKDHVRNRYKKLEDMHKSIGKAESLINKEMMRLNKKMAVLK